ncbi:MAG TPA: ABC transporter ATP-binding protein [Planctomycetes bacterium]|nr:ABC transporter ATP-binding protein [Planctomycetota bacterium]
MSGIIKVENLSFAYRSQGTIVKDISFEVMQGTFLTIAGPNGAGKTTLLNLLCGLLSAQAGSIKIDAAHIESYSVKELAQKLAVVRQEFVPVFDFTVAQVVSMARTPYLGTFGFESQADMKFINEALEMTDTKQFSSRPLAELSGGERQRVFIARALAQNTPILLLDEPTSFLDLKHQVGIYDLLKTMQLEKGKTIVAVTHDINLAAQYADVTLLLGADTSYQYGRAQDVFSPEQIERVFGVRAFTGKIGEEKFFIPLGKFAKDRSRIGRKVDSS